MKQQATMENGRLKYEKTQYVLHTHVVAFSSDISLASTTAINGSEAFQFQTTGWLSS
jgi:hypothetical protein